jgi:uncharacterized membrane protein YhaH (DUF805 family)
MIGFVEAIRNGFEQYVNPRGRASRAEFWWWWLTTGLVSTLTEGSALNTLVVLGLFLPTVMVLIRRLHDTDRSGWWALIAFVPVIGLIALLVLLALPGDKVSNRFGPPRMPSALSGRAGRGTTGGFGGFSGGDPGPRGGTSGGSSTPDIPSPGGWPHGGDTPPRSSGWDDLPPPPPSSR